MESIGDTIFIGTFDGVYRSVNNGTSWTFASTGIPTGNLGMGYGRITGLAKIGSTLYASQAKHGMYKSVNRGDSWVQVNTGLADTNMLAVYSKGDTLFAGSVNAGIFTTTNGGNSWTSVNNGLADGPVNCFYQHGTKLFSGGQLGVYETQNGGVNWNEANNGIAGYVVGNAGRYSSFIRAGQYLFTATKGGNNFRSADNGNTWQITGRGVIPDYVGAYYNLSFAYADSTLLFSYEYGLFRSEDMGDTWVKLTTGHPDQMVDIIGIGNRFFAAAPSGFYVSDDGGINWSIESSQPNMPSNMFIKGNDLFVNVGNDIYRSHWGIEPFTIVGTLPVTIISTFGVLGDTIFCAASPTGMYKSIDDGVSWTTAGLTDTLVLNLTRSGNVLFARTSDNVFARNNAEGSWAMITSDLPFDQYAPGRDSWALKEDSGQIFVSVSSHSLYKAVVTQFNFTPPDQPGPITGSTTPCIGSTQTYSVDNVPGVSYTWQLPVSWTLLSGQGTSSISATIGNIPGTITVTPSNIYGSGNLQYLVAMPTTDPPAQPSDITGPANPLEGASQTYSVVNDPGVTYTWTFPAGWVQTAGDTTNSVTVSVGAGSGDIQVTPSTPCGTGTPRILSVAPVPISLTVTNIIISGGQVQCFNAVGTIYVAGDNTTFTVQAGGSATMIAGQNIIYLPGTTVDSGGYMHGYISTEFCMNPSNPVVNNPLAHTDALLMNGDSAINTMVRIYPNPTPGDFTLEIAGNPDTGIQIEIFSISGNRVFVKNIHGAKNTINTGELQRGMYFIHLTTGTKKEVVKLIKL